jgi:hypothetical protein
LLLPDGDYEARARARHAKTRFAEFANAGVLIANAKHQLRASRSRSNDRYEM